MDKSREKKVAFDHDLTVHETLDYDRRLTWVADAARFQLRIKKFDQLFSSVVIKEYQAKLSSLYHGGQ